MNQTRYLMISSQRPWTLDQEADRQSQYMKYKTDFIIDCLSIKCFYISYVFVA